MATAHAIRLQIETKLAQRVPALTLKIKHAPEVFATGITAVDEILGGGIPRGCITEVSGAASTGKTSFALSTLASITQLGNACAWVDVSDALSPVAAAAAGVELRRLLWLRMSAERGKKVVDKPWSRLQARTSLIFLTQSPCASSCASLALRCELAETMPFSSIGETSLFERRQYQLTRERNRNESIPFIQRKPTQRVSWPAETLWSRVR
jgi:recA bacterial DNA recombination protein